MNVFDDGVCQDTFKCIRMPRKQFHDQSPLTTSVADVFVQLVYIAKDLFGFND
jgi:hypothetical protein